MPPLHVCMVCCQHVPDDVRVTHKMGMAMKGAGFRVTWVGPERPRSGPDYGMEFRYYPAAAGKLNRLLRFKQAMEAAERVPDVDVYYAPEPDSAYVANRLGRRHRAKSVFDIHEVYHEEMLGRWVSAPARPIVSGAVRRVLRHICSKADLVVAVSRAVMDPYADVGASHLIVRNCAPMSFGEGTAAKVFDGTRPVTVMHGKTTLAHGTTKVIEALGIARRSVPDLRAVMFRAFGSHTDGFDETDLMATAARAAASDSIDLRDPVPLAGVSRILRTCDIGLVAYDRTWGVNSLPNKLFEYMGAGIPVIAPAYSREIRKIVEAERCGILVDCENAAEIAGAIEHLSAHRAEAQAMGERGRAAFMARHNWQVEVLPVLEQIREWGKAGAA